MNKEMGITKINTALQNSASQRSLFQTKQTSQKQQQQKKMNQLKNIKQIIPKIENKIIKQQYQQQQQQINDKYLRIINIMRQQIQISNKFYTNKMKQLIYGQAKQIIYLKNKIQDNQKQFQKKQHLIQQYQIHLQNINKENTKKKISITTQSSQKIISLQYKNICQKISTLQDKLSNIQSYINEKHQIQKYLNFKIQFLQKSVIKCMGAKLSSCVNKIDKFITSKQKEMQKIQSDIQNMKNLLTTPPRTQNHLQPIPSNPNITSSHSLSRAISSPNIQLQHSSSLNINKNNQKQVSPSIKISKLNQQLNDIKQQLNQIKTKQYKYDNCQIEQLREQLIKLKKYFYHQQNIRKQKIRSMGVIQDKPNDVVKNKQTITRNYSNANVIKVNLINNQTIKNDNYQFNQRKISNQKTQNHSIKAHRQSPHNYQQHTLHQNYQSNMYTHQGNGLNFSTPTTYNQPANISTYNKLNRTAKLSTEASTSHISNYYTINNQQQNKKIHPQNPQNKELKNKSNLPNNLSHTQNIKFYYDKNNNNNINQYMSKTLQQPSKTPIIKHTSHYNNNHNNNRQQKYVNQILKSTSQCDLQCEEQPSQIDQYTYNDQQDYDQSQASYQNNQQRLLRTIQNSGLIKPISVEIDQTGYLKCTTTAMYLVDENNDGFQLSDEQIKHFTSLGIIKIQTQSHNNKFNMNKINNNSNCNTNKRVKYK